MRTKSAGYLGCIAALVSVTAQPSEPAPIYVRGYYRFYERNSVWQYDGMPELLYNSNRAPVALWYGGPH